MPKILFASNNISHFPGSVPGSAAGTFDPLRVPYAVLLTNYQLLSSPDFNPSTGDTTWFHFRSFADGNGYSIPTGSTGILWQTLDGSNRMLAKLTKKTSVYTQSLTLTLYNGSTTVTADTTFPMTQSRMNFIDISLKITPVLIRADVYINGALACFASFGSNPNSLTNPVRFSLGCSHTESLALGQSFSEIIVADGDTRNARLNFLRPVTEGVYSNWNGNLSSLGDDDPTSGLYTKVPNQRHSANLSTYIGAQNLSNLVSVSQTTRGLNSPSKIKHTIRQGGVDYDSPNINLPYSLQYNLYDLQLNPATGLPWTSDDLSSLEVGILSVA